jgi:electron transfer flavoprotein beta subunit
VPAGVATLLGLPYLSYAAKIEPEPEQRRVRVHRISATGYDVLEAPMPALVVATQALGEPRYPSLKGIMAARSKSLETRSLGDVVEGGDAVGGASATNEVLAAEAPPPRAATRVIREPADQAARELVAFLAERRII